MVVRPTLPAGMLKHAFGDIHSNTGGLWKATVQGATEMTGSATQVDPALWINTRRQLFEQCAPHCTLQFSDAVVAGGSTRERGSNLALVRQSTGQARQR
ncbi:hypothetical protein D3C79_956940 [compost metagenome]